MSDYELYHYGIKGMKWGVRKSIKKSASAIRKRVKARREETKAMKEDMGTSGQTSVSLLVTAAGFKAMETRAKQAANASLLRLEKGNGKSYRFVTDLADGWELVEPIK